MSEKAVTSRLVQNITICNEHYYAVIYENTWYTGKVTNKNNLDFDNEKKRILSTFTGQNKKIYLEIYKMLRLYKSFMDQ